MDGGSDVLITGRTDSDSVGKKRAMKETEREPTFTDQRRKQIIKVWPELHLMEYTFYK